MTDAPKKRVQGKRWCFTINNPEIGEMDLINWGVFGGCQMERGSECGTAHIQGFVIFETNQSLKAVKAIHPRAHWELMKGELEDNEKYCSKEFNKDGSVGRLPGTEPKVWGTRPLGRRHSLRPALYFDTDPIRVTTLDFSFLQDEIGGGYCSGINSQVSPWYQGIDPIADFGL